MEQSTSMQARLNLQQLSAFLTLADNGNFGDAAEALGVSQPALSRTIQQIEGKLGARLFDRDTRKLRLTPAGERLEPLARRLMNEYQEVFAEFDDFVAGRQGVVRIAAFPSVAALLLPGTIVGFASANPMCASRSGKTWAGRFTKPCSKVAPTSACRRRHPSVAICVIARYCVMK